VSVAAQSILGHLPVEVFEVGVVGEMVTRFHERAEWCSHLKASGAGVCNLVLGLANGQVHLVNRLGEVTRQL
jgi:hypothetical protein